MEGGVGGRRGVGGRDSDVINGTCIPDVVMCQYDKCY